MTLALAFLLLLLTVPLFGGKLSRVGEVRIRWIWLAAAAFGIQVVLVTVVPDGDSTVHRILHLATYVLAAACLIRNLDLRFVWLVGVGGLLNLIAIAANGGVMPASRSALETAGLDAGITPPLAAIAIRFKRPPTPTSQTNADPGSESGTRRPKVGREVQDSVHGAVAVGHHSDQHNLDPERRGGQPNPADPHLPDAAQFAAKERHSQEQKKKGEGEGHTGAGYSIVAICGVRLTSLKA